MKGVDEYFGYKNHAKVNTKSKLIRSHTVTSAKVHDSQVVERLINEIEKGKLIKDAPVITPKIMDYTDRHIFAQYSIRVNNRSDV